MNARIRLRRLQLASFYAPAALGSWAVLGAENVAPKVSNLPLTEVVLYSSGVGYFERIGEVDGRAEVDLRFKTDDINDLLKSMVVQDFNGGRVTTVTYGSRDPLNKTLRSFSLDLTQNPTLGGLLNQARGERVEVLWPSKVAGTILGVEKKKEPSGEKNEREVEYLNLLTDDGLHAIPLALVQKTKLLNERLNAELRQALEVLATGHDTQKKTVAVSFDGQGKRRVGVSYIAQTPVWKTSYRLVLDEKAKPFLQGWAIVENTSDEDWENVKLSLVSGRPISFTMDLYQPLYTTRPVVTPELYSSLRPQVYGEAMDRPVAAPQLTAKASESLARRSNRDEKTLSLAASAPANAVVTATASDSQHFFGAENQAVVPSPDSLTGSQGGQVGELFRYQITAPVSLARQKSAMLPIINQSVDGEKVSIYNQNVQAKHPLNGFRLKNSSKLHLMQGPITVYDQGTYAGDARIEDIAPGQERLASYGLDVKTEVEPQRSSGRSDLVTVKIRKGTLIATRKGMEEMTYNVRNRDQKPKTVLVEHPFRSDWNLSEPKQKPERTREVYRFPVSVEADKSEKLVVREERQFEEQVSILNSPNDLIAYFIRAREVSAKAKQALEKVATLRDAINETDQEIQRRHQRTAEITQEQNRIRENMAKLNANSELYTRYVKKLDQQETDLENLRQEIERLKEKFSQQQRELNDYAMNLSID